MTLEDYERIYRETTLVAHMERHSGDPCLWNRIYDRKVAEQLEREHERRVRA